MTRNGAAGGTGVGPPRNRDEREKKEKKKRRKEGMLHFHTEESLKCDYHSSTI